MPDIEVEMMGDGHDLFVVVDGLKVARRGYPGTTDAHTWVMLEPGWHVEGDARIIITYHPPTRH